MSQLLELSDKDFKAAIATLFTKVMKNRLSCMER